ncbi:MAG: aspartate kinase, partial [Fusobacterium sp.]|nr:aspartate kinase [Fusobacterium sp.]
INRNRKTDISFSCTLGEKYLLDQVVKQIKSKYPEIEIEYEDNLGMISVVGIGMINNSEIAGRFFFSIK